MSFDSTANNLIKIPIASPHTNGASSLVLAVSGAAFPAAPFRLTAITGATYGTSAESLTIYTVSAVAANTPSSGQCTLTVATAEGTSDQAYGTSDYAEMRLTAGTISDLNTAVSTSIATINAETSLPNSRKLTAGTNVTLVDNGAGSTLVINAAGGSGGTPGGSNGQIQYNNASAFGGFTASGDWTIITSTGVATLATVNGNVGSFGGASSVPELTVNAKGLVTSASAAAVVAPAGTLSGTTLNATVVASSLTSVGTIATGAWNGTTIAPAHGGTGLANLTAHGVMLGEGTSNVAFATAGTAGRLLIDQGAAADPAFEAMSGDATITSAGVITVGAAAITYAKIQHVGASSLLGNPTGVSATASEITLGSGLSFVAGALTASSGSGTVTSVTFTGDGTVLSATPSSAVTTSGTVTAALASAGAYTVLANNTASSATPTYTFGMMGYQVTTTAGTVTLTANSASYQVSDTLTAGGVITYDMPAASTCPGKVFLFVTTTTAHNTVLTRAGSDTFVGASSTTSITFFSTTVPQGFISDGVSKWWPCTPQIGSFNSAISLVSGGTGNTALVTQGGVIWGQTANTMGTTAAGTSGQVLQSAGTAVPTWTSTPGGGTALTSVTTAALDLSTAQTTVNGTAGSYIWAQPFQGGSYKKVVIYLTGYSNTATSAIVFPTAFTQTPALAFNGTTLSISTLSGTGVTIPISTTQTGFIILEGY